MNKATRQVVIARLNRIANAHHGRLTPELVVRDARDRKSPLHKLFEWDDSKAAHAYRIEQARRVITIRCEERLTVRELAAPCFVRDPAAAAAEQGYRSVASLKDDKDAAREVVEDELRRIVSAIERARAIADELGLGPELEELLARVGAIRTAARRAA